MRICAWFSGSAGAEFGSWPNAPTATGSAEEMAAQAFVLFLDLAEARRGAVLSGIGLGGERMPEASICEKSATQVFDAHDAETAPLLQDDGNFSRKNERKHSSCALRRILFVGGNNASRFEFTTRKGTCYPADVRCPRPNFRFSRSGPPLQTFTQKKVPDEICDDVQECGSA